MWAGVSVSNTVVSWSAISNSEVDFSIFSMWYSPGSRTNRRQDSRNESSGNSEPARQSVINTQKAMIYNNNSKIVIII